jgi:hypothetical protein
MTSTPITTTGWRYQPPVARQAWCTDQNGHPNYLAREDQTCFSEVLRIDLALAPSINESVYDPATGKFPPARTLSTSTSDRTAGSESRWSRCGATTTRPSSRFASPLARRSS